jgi:uncharacterized OsmC-like protein
LYRHQKIDAKLQFLEAITMVTAEVNYLGGLRTECKHLRSGTIILTDAPIDNHGKGESFSPTDLVATAYASCMLSIIGIHCNENNMVFTHGKASVLKVMESEPRRISRIEIAMELSGNGWTAAEAERILRVAKACPVAKSVHENIEIEFTYTIE